MIKFNGSNGSSYTLVQKTSCINVYYIDIKYYINIK